MSHEIVGEEEAKALFPRLIDRVARGEVIIIGRDGHPIAKLVPFEERSRRVPGAWRGRVRIEADFDELPEDLLSAFEPRNPSVGGTEASRKLR